MKIVFSKTITGDDENIISIQQQEKEILLTCSYQHFITKDYLEQSYLMNKKQLHEFIGALLHIQQKMKGGNND